MNNLNALCFILHVSDFHLTDDENDKRHALNALNALTTKLAKKGIKVDYLVHTGDVINSSDLYQKIAEKNNLLEKYAKSELGKKNEKIFDSKKFEKEGKEKEKEDFNSDLKEITKKRFDTAKEVLEQFVTDLNLSVGNVAICCGNHDALRPIMLSDNHASCK